MQNEDGLAHLAAIGLCGSCRHRRAQTNPRGSVFHRCARADDDPSFLRYPPLPVRHCRGYTPSDPNAPDSER